MSLVHPNAPLGYASTIHQGPLQPVTIWYAPYEYVVFNVLIAMIMCLWISWRWILIAVGIHLGLMAFWFYDPHLLPIVVKHLRYARFYGTW